MDKMIEKIKAERSDLNGKISRLSEFLEFIEFNRPIKISRLHIDLLRTQLNVMIAYSRILTLRLEDLGED